MIKLEIRTQGYQELHPFLEFQDAKYLTLEAANIVQGGTVEGRTTVELFFTDEEGNRYYAGTSARVIVNGLAAAVRGTAERFGDDLSQA